MTESGIVPGSSLPEVVGSTGLDGICPGRAIRRRYRRAGAFDMNATDVDSHPRRAHHDTFAAPPFCHLRQVSRMIRGNAMIAIDPARKAVVVSAIDRDEP